MAFCCRAIVVSTVLRYMGTDMGSPKEKTREAFSHAGFICIFGGEGVLKNVSITRHCSRFRNIFL